MGVMETDKQNDLHKATKVLAPNLPVGKHFVAMGTLALCSSGERPLVAVCLSNEHFMLKFPEAPAPINSYSLPFWLDSFNQSHLV